MKAAQRMAATDPPAMISDSIARTRPQKRLRSAYAYSTSTGGVRKQRGRWIGLWYENGIKKSKVIGLVKDMTKGEARDVVGKIVAEIRAMQERQSPLKFSGFVENAYFAFYSRKWKVSTCENNKQRIRSNLVAAYPDRELTSFKRDELQDLLDAKAETHSFSVVDHLRWDLKQIFDMAAAEGRPYHAESGASVVHAEGRGTAFTPDHDGS